MLLFILKKYIRYTGNNPLVRIISKITNLSIIFGSLALLVALSIINGFNYQLNNTLFDLIPSITIESNLSNINFINENLVINKLKNNYQIKSINPFIDTPAVINHLSKIKTVLIQSYSQSNSKMLEKYINPKDLANFSGEEVIIGSGLASELNIKEGSYINILLPNQGKVETKVLKVFKIINLKGFLNESYLASPINTLRNWYNLKGNYVSGVNIFYKNPLNINNFNYTYFFKNGYNISTWKQNFNYIYQDIVMMKRVIYLAFGFIILIACFNILSTLILEIEARKNDIAILKTLGITNASIILVFTLKGSYIGAKNSLIGVIIGSIISYKLTYILNIIQNIFNFKILSSKFYFINFIPSKLILWNIGVIFILTILISATISLYPAIKASRINIPKTLNSN